MRAKDLSTGCIVPGEGIVRHVGFDAAGVLVTFTNDKQRRYKRSEWLKGAN